jgi:hypothetical protein
MYTKFRYANAKLWLEQLCKSEKHPNAEQLRLLHAVIQRCRTEEREFRLATPPERTSQPLQGCLLAPPGTGKTQCILWIIDFFEKVCGWKMGDEFQTTASQNTMASAIRGDTNHAWGQVPINIADASAQDVKKNKDGVSIMYLKNMALRWLIIDEISTSPLAVLGTMESKLRRACQRHVHAKDANGDERPWGGLNLLTGGDWLQLPPVKAKAIFKNPFAKDFSPPERRISQMFWHLDDLALPNAREYLFELTEQNRSKDVWLIEMLRQDRLGEESFTVRVNGFPDLGRRAAFATAAQRYPLM